MNDQNAKRDSGKVEITLVPMEMVEAAEQQVNIFDFMGDD